ncbi:transposase [Microbispora sp. NPDC049633]|uniref:transposase n=1 Tax=Microbispora sp. NPDC049633 TaxID=3154355 RepID=UPI003428F49B
MVYKPRMKYDPSVKAAAVDAVINKNIAPRVVARRYHVVPRTLYKWCSDARTEIYAQILGERAAVQNDSAFESGLAQLIDSLPEAVLTEPEPVDEVSDEQLADEVGAEADEAYADRLTELQEEVNRLRQQLVQRTTERDMWAAKATQAA